MSSPVSGGHAVSLDLSRNHQEVILVQYSFCVQEITNHFVNNPACSPIQPFILHAPNIQRQHSPAKKYWFLSTIWNPPYSFYNILPYDSTTTLLARHYTECTMFSRSVIPAKNKVSTQYWIMLRNIWRYFLMLGFNVVRNRTPDHQTQGVQPMSAQCWLNVCDAGPALHQSWVNVSSFPSLLGTYKK